jgi:hypothetical protein
LLVEALESSLKGANLLFSPPSSPWLKKSQLRSLDLTDVHPAVVFSPVLASQQD